MRTAAPTPHTDRLSRMELAISYALRGGVLLSATVILIGTLTMGWTGQTGYGPVPRHHVDRLLAYHRSGEASQFPTTPRAVLDGVRAGRPSALIAFGLLLLIATPVVRVALSVAFFLSQADWLYVGITLSVLAILIASFLTGRA